MRVLISFLLALTQLGAAINSVSAAEMSCSRIMRLISGKSVYLKLYDEAASGDSGVIYFAVDGRTVFKNDQGLIWHGRWSINGNTSCVNWIEAPGNPCSKYRSSKRGIEIVNVATNRVRGTILKVVAGNRERITP